MTRNMSQTITEDQVVTAAKDLNKDEFTRAELAESLSVERPDIKEGFRAARQAGKLEKVRNDDGTGVFKLSNS